MSSPPSPAPRYPLLQAPAYTPALLRGERPTVREALREGLDAVDLRRGVSRLVPALYAAAAYALGGGLGVLTWLTGAFVFATLMRDFNWRAHGGGAAHTAARNQGFYGVMAGEWHLNHHLHPRSARAGLTARELDVPFLVVRLMHALGMVGAYQLPAGRVARAPQAVVAQAE